MAVRKGRPLGGGRPGSLGLPGCWSGGKLICESLACTPFFECAVCDIGPKFEEKHNAALQKHFEKTCKEVRSRFSSLQWFLIQNSCSLARWEEEAEGAGLWGQSPESSSPPGSQRPLAPGEGGQDHIPPETPARGEGRLGRVSDASPRGPWTELLGVRASPGNVSGELARAPGLRLPVAVTRCWTAEARLQLGLCRCWL